MKTECLVANSSGRRNGLGHRDNLLKEIVILSARHSASIAVFPLR